MGLLQKRKEKRMKRGGEEVFHPPIKKPVKTKPKFKPQQLKFEFPPHEEVEEEQIVEIQEQVVEKKEYTQLEIDFSVKEGVSILIPAYKSQDFIEECLDSIESQTYFNNNDNYEILVGVDNCQETLNKLLEIRHKYRNLRVFMMEKNVSWPIVSNTLLDLIKHDLFIRFDADDIMYPHMVNEIIKHSDFDIIRFKFNEFGNSDRIAPKFSEGVIAYKKKIFETYGGFQPWVCGADTEFLNRIHFDKSLKIKRINANLFGRRVHPQSLTQNPQTGRGSVVRSQYQKKIKEMNRKTPTKIPRIKVEYYEIENSNNKPFLSPKKVNFSFGLKNKDTIGVIRSCGERTTELCYRLLKPQVSKIEIVKETPSYKATKKQYELAMESGCKWLISVDADELIFPNAVEKLVNFAEIRGDILYSVYGLFDCKLLLKEREGVPRIYKVDLLNKAYQFISDRIRPDAHVCNQMNRLGHQQYMIPELLAWHDYEQYYVDLYRKGYVHAIKFKELTKTLHKKWEIMSNQDLDYMAALMGYKDGLKHRGSMSIDRTLFDDNRILNKLGFEEKPKLRITQDLLKIYNLK